MQMINQTVKTSEHELNTNDIIFLYACGPVSLLGFLLCLTSTLVFSSSEFKSSSLSHHLFTYLRFECVFMTANLFIKILFTISNSKQWRDEVNIHFAKIVYIYLNGYLSSVLETCVTLSNIFSSTCCLSITTTSRNRNGESSSSSFNSTIKAISMLNSYLLMGVSCLLAALVFLHLIFSISYDGSEENFIMFNADFFKPIHAYFDFFAFTTRDVLLLIVLITLNLIMAVRIRHKLSKKLTRVSRHSAGYRLVYNGSEY